MCRQTCRHKGGESRASAEMPPSHWGNSPVVPHSFGDRKAITKQIETLHPSFR